MKGTKKERIYEKERKQFNRILIHKHKRDSF